MPYNVCGEESCPKTEIKNNGLFLGFRGRIVFSIYSACLNAGTHTPSCELSTTPTIGVLSRASTLRYVACGINVGIRVNLPHAESPYRGIDAIRDHHYFATVMMLGPLLHQIDGR